MGAEKKQMLTVSNIRNINIVNMMHSLIKGKTRTRSELAQENSISVMTVKHIVDDLIRAKILTERASKGNEVGRKPKTLEIAGNYGNIVCINLTSVEEISFMIYDIYEELLDQGVLEVDPARGYRENLLGAIGEIKKSMAVLGTETVGGAVFVPSAYYEDVDLVNYDLIAGFKELHVKELFTRELGISNILVLHDVVPAAHSEYDSLNPAQESQFYFYCGHGVGGFFIHKGTAVMGEQLMAGEVGKMILRTGDADGSFQTFEEMVSVSALDKKLKERGISKRFKEVIRDYGRQGEQERKIADQALDAAVRVLYNLLWVYNPSRLVIDSCYEEYGEKIIERFREFMEELKKEEIPIQVQVRQAKYDEYHMMRGCFRMVRESWVEDIAAAVSEKGAADS